MERGSRYYPMELLWNLTLRELRGKYKRSILGWGWSLVNPIVFMGVYSLVFGAILKTEIDPGNPSGNHLFPFFLVSALLPWTFHANSVNGSVGNLASNTNLIRKVYFRRSVLPASTVLSWLVTFSIELGVLTVAFAAAGYNVVVWLPLVVPVTLLLAAFSLGIGLAASALNAFFRDIEYLTNLVMMVWFWGTPIVYPARLANGHTIMGLDATTLLRCNPMYHFIGAYRNLFFDLRAPSAGTWLVMAGSAAASLTLGTLVFRRIEPRLAEEL